MSNILVTTQQSVIDVTNNNGITVTTPEGQTINVEVPNSSVNVTNTTDDITILTAGTLNIQTGGITSVNGQTGPVVVLDTNDISEGVTNKYFSQTLARQSLSAGTGISYDNSTGVITNTSINTDTTYTQNISSTTGGANLNLVGSDSSTDTVKFANGTGVTVSYTDANTATIAIGQSVGTGDSPSFSGGTFGNITVGVDTDNTIGTTDTNGNIILTPNGVGNVVSTRNYVKGSVRDSTTATNGDVFSFSNGSGGPTRGLSIDNSIDTSKRPGVVLRAYGASLGGTNPQATFITETAKGSAATPTGLASGNSLGSWLAGGYADTSVGGSSPGWATDTTGSNLASVGFITTEAFTSGTTNLGTQVSIRSNPTGSGNAIQTSMAINPQSTISRSDAFTWQQGKSGSSTTMVLDVNGNLTTTGDLRINGGDIQASDGNTNITLTSNTLTTFTGSTVINGNITTLGTATFNNELALNAKSELLDTNTLAGTTLAIQTNYKTSSGGTLSVPQNGWQLGNFRFNSNYDSAGGYVLGAQVTAGATENWTSTANGSNINFFANKVGQSWTTGLTTVASFSPETATLISDSFTFKDLNNDTNLTIDNSGNVIITGDLDVKGSDITNSTGALTISTGASDGNITLDPNGSGDIVLTLANGGNLTNSRNYVHGAIRNSTTESSGDIWALNSTGPLMPFRGVSVDNSSDTTKLPGYLARSYSNTATFRPRFIFERARGTAASPTAVQNGDFLGEVDATGYTSTGWLNDNIITGGGVPAFFGFNAAENWVSNTNLGTAFTLSLAPTATTITSGANNVSVLSVNPQTFASRSDAFTWANGKTGTTQTMALDVNGNLTITGDLRVNGNDIKASDGATAMTMVPITSNNPNTDFSGNIVKGTLRTGNGESNGNIFELFGPLGQSTGLSIDNTDKTADRTSVVLRNYGSGLIGGLPRTNIIMEAARGTAASPTNLGNNDNILELQGSGYTSTGWVTDQVSAPPSIVRVRASEAWSNGLNNVGTKFQVLLQPQATTLTAGGASLQTSLQISPENSFIRSDQMGFYSKSNEPLVSINQDNNGKNTFSVNQLRATSSDQFALVNFTAARSTDGINYTPTQNNDTLGSFKFNGNAYTGTNYGVPGGPGAEITGKATENWTSTANGTRFELYAMKTGTLDSYRVLSANPDQIKLNANTTEFKNYNDSVTFATFNDTSATFTRPVGFPVDTAANWNAVTGSVGQQVCVSDSAAGSNPDGMMAFWDTTHSRWSYIHDNSAV